MSKEMRSETADGSKLSIEMESVPKIYAMGPYFDRVQISEMHPFRDFFRPSVDISLLF
ncbi:hypothetical protein GCM10007863_45790 [Dyella mobilis]|uniref:Uncharacterized protein n=2 Tax=Pseudomonadota TaxID=1224 RepID=A0ABQ6DC60_9HYPH|nr:hypothetical protein GCM10007863_45790 [Dyella mobilis]GLS47073.1 hypothetical protein GCM10007884_50750 [Methylobacterium brachythecii]GLS61307.1 hypothetical protein GCM10007887_40100 [Methylobacterium haplocladii]GLT24751.1 hypothetical protein GCM10007933_42470 [Zoogloea oryzae]